MQKSVVAVGEMLWDVFGNTKTPGGSSMNVALHLHKQGVKSQLISAIGDDALGVHLKKQLDEQHFPTGLIQTNNFPTSTVRVKLDKRHHASYDIVQPVAWDAIELCNEALDAVAQADAFVYCSLTCREAISEATIKALLTVAKLKVFDINLRPPHFRFELLKELLAEADILKINEDEIEYLRQECKMGATNISDLVIAVANMFDIKTVCLTLGASGATVFHKGSFFHHRGFEVSVADTVGAGDAFLATFIASYLNGHNMDDVLTRACKVGAFVASQPGANPSYDETVFH